MSETPRKSHNVSILMIMTNNLSFSEKKDKPDTPQLAAGRVHLIR
jgi:hypothetical protein